MCRTASSTATASTVPVTVRAARRRATAAGVRGGGRGRATARAVAAAATAVVTATLSLAAFTPGAGAATAGAAHAAAPLLWATENLRGEVTLTGQVPLVVADAAGTPMRGVRLVGAASARATISLNFGLPLRNTAALDALISKEAKTHRDVPRSELYAEFSPPAAQYEALRKWLVQQGYRITHVGADRLEITASAPVAVIDRSLDLRVKVFHTDAYVDDGVQVAAQDFYANTTAPRVPARLGIQTVSGLSNVDQFFTDVQLEQAAAKAGGGSGAASSAAAGAVTPHTRSGGYYPKDLRSMYDVQDLDDYGTGQTIGFTLWGAGEVQAAASYFATETGEPALTVDTPCTATGNSPTSPSSCTTIQEPPNYLLNILENGNTNNNYGGNEETGLDVETAHGMAPGVAEKYYLGDCSATPSPGDENGAGCNGSDVGLEDAIEDAANDPTLHSVSDSWGYGGDPEWGAADPFSIAAENSLAIGAAAGTTFWFSTGDTGTYESGFPADSPYVVAVGGTTLFSTQSLANTGAGTGVLSTEDTWAAGGSWCSNVFPRPAWQTGAGVTANATCPGRAVPDISAIADTNSAVFEVYSTGATTYGHGSVGGTSVAGPVMNGMEADTENFVAAQSYAGGSTPATGFEGPVMYELGNSADSTSFFRDVLCGNDADPSGGPDGEAAQPGWDEATGWGAIDWADYSTGYAMQLGATGLSVPASLSQDYQWDCAKTPGNSTEHGVSFPSATVGFAVGSAASSPWPGTYLPSHAWGATNTFYTTTDGGADWVPSNSDMMSIACTSAADCVEVGDGGVIKVTTDGGAVWTADTTTFNQALTQVTCPSSSTCYAAGDRGTVLVSQDGGNTWSFTASVDGNPIYGLSCPTTTTCYTVDDYGHVMSTTDGGGTWTLQSTPVTAPGVNVPGSGGPQPYSGLFGVSCVSATECVAVGGYPQSGATVPPIVTTTDGTDWSNATSDNAAASDYLLGVTCLSGTTTCYAVGYSGTIVTTTDLTDWSTMTSGTTETLTGISCLSTSYCVATGQGGTIDVLSGGTWTTTTTTIGASAWLYGVTCLAADDCFATGKQGVTVSFDSTNIAPTIIQLAGGGTTQTMDSISCVSTSTCVAVGAAGTILGTTNGGQTWLPQTSGVAGALDSVSCYAADCIAAGASGTILATTNGGASWAAQTSGVSVTLAGVSCDADGCVVVGAASGGSGTILIAGSPAGGTWTPETDGVNANLNAVTCLAADCWAVGAIPSVATTAAIVVSTNGGASWSAQTSNAPQTLSAVACADPLDCFAGGAIGTVMATNNGGTTWYQEGNPVSGPTTALNAGPSSITAIDGAACSPTDCFMAMASSGNIMMTPLLSVTVTASGTYGTTPQLSSIAPSSADLSYSPSIPSADVTGSLTCSTTATAASDVGSYPVGGCSGLSSDGYNVVYDYPASSYDVTQASNVITFAPVATQTYGEPTFQVDPTASSGLPVSVVASGDCSLDSSTAPADVTLTAAGSCIITASQAGDADYVAASNASQAFAIDQGSQLIDFTGIPGEPYGTAEFPISPVATSGLPVSLSATGPCTLSSSTSPAEVDVTGIGECSITASQPGDGDWTAAAPVTQSFSTLQNQTIDFAGLPGVTYGASPIALSATASSGLAVAYQSSGPCSVAGATLTITGAGTCVVLATQPGDADYNPAPDVAQSFVISPAGQSLDFGQLPAVDFVGSPDYTMDATASSGLLVTYAVGATDECTVQADVVTVTGAGSCTVTASQAGDGDYQAATPVSETFLIDAGTPAVTVTASPSPATIGSVDYSVTLTGVATTPPTGSVTVSDGSATCPVSLASGTGSCSIVEGAGSYTVQASYGGDGNYTSATGSLAETVEPATPTLSIVALESPATTSAVGYEVSASGVGGFAVTGSVTVSDGTASCVIASFSALGSCALLEGAGTYTVEAAYTGDDDYTAATASISETVGTATPTVSVSASPSPAGGPGPVAYQVSVAGAAGIVPTGQVTVSDGGSSCPITLVGGSGACSLDEAAAGYDVVATYGGDANYGRAAGSVSEQVEQATPTVSISPASDPAAGPGSVTYDVAVGGVPGFVPSGGVTVSDGATSCDVLTLVAGGGSCSLVEGAGTYSVQATYSGDSNYLSADGSTSETVAKAIPSVSVSPSADPHGGPGTVGYSVTVTGVAGFTPGGSVSVSDGTSTCQIAALSGGSGSCQLSEGSGTYVVVAGYGGDGNYTQANGSVTETVSKDTPAVSVHASANPATGPGPVTYQVTVSGASGFTPTGGVTVSDGTQTCGVPSLTAGAGSCTIVEPAGSYTVQATYSGDTDDNTSTGMLSEVVDKATPTVTVTPSVSPAPAPGEVTYLVEVSGASGFVPTGSVSVSDGSSSCEIADLVGSGACAIDEPAGAYTVVASYSGDGNDDAASGSVGETVAKAVPQVTVTASADPSAAPGDVTYAVTVAGAPGFTPTGSVSVGDGTRSCSINSLAAGAGQCAISEPAGVYTVQASYSGDAEDTAATASLLELVDKATPHLSISPSSNPASKPGPVTYRVTASGVAGFAVSGSLTVSDGTRSCSITAFSGSGSCAINEPAGTYTVKASYGGNADYEPATATVSERVSKATPAVAISSSANPAPKAETVTYSVTVTGVAGFTPSGTVTVSDGHRTCTATLSSSGKGSCGISEPAGTYTVTAKYGGNTNYNTASTSLKETVK